MPGELEVEKPADGGPGAGEGEEENGAESEAAAEEKKEPPAAKPMVGIIYPPPEVRNIVDKTADFVARNGPEFEVRIKMNEAGNVKFNFLNAADPYHAYYQHKIKEVQEGVAQEMAEAGVMGVLKPPPKPPVMVVVEAEPPKEPPPDFEFMCVEPPSISAMELDVVKLTAQFVARNGAQFLDKLITREQRNFQFDFLRKQHPLFNYFTKLVEQYSKVLLPSLEMINRLNGDSERTLNVLDRAQKRADWELFQIQEKRKAEEIQEKERMEYSQVDWHDFVIVETISFRESEAGYLPPPIRPSQLAQRLLQQQKFERQADEGGEVQEIEMEVEEPDAEEPVMQERPRNPPEPSPGLPPPLPRPPSPPPPPQATGVQIRRDYNPKVIPSPAVQPPPAQQFLISPITGEKIPADKMQEHMRFSLLDRRWIDERKRQVSEKRTQEEVYAEGMQIGTNLRLLAERRTDIFGAEETVIGKKIGEEERQGPAVQWDGHSGTSDMIRQQAHSKVTKEQIEASDRARGLLPDPTKEHIGPKSTSAPPMPPPPSHPHHHPPSHPHHPPPPGSRPPPPHQPPPPHFYAQRPPPPPGTGGIPPPPGVSSAPPSQPPLPPLPHNPQGPGLLPTPPAFHPPPPHLPNSAPPALPPHQPPPMVPDLAPPVAKRLRTEADELMPESEFVAANPGPVTFKVQVPLVLERPEWKLTGQVIAITLPVTDPVSVIKAKIADELGMPTGKQKLQIGSIFIKDSNSLGFYNMTATSTVLLGLKERGGRRK